MSIMSEYASIKSELYSAIEDALPYIAEGLYSEINTAAEKFVYSYQASQEAMKTRRYEIGDKGSFEEEYGPDYVKITNRTEPQGTDYGVAEVDFVEEGMPDYKQPYPREFMTKALEKYISSGKADAILKNVLVNHGLNADLTVVGE